MLYVFCVSCVRVVWLWGVNKRKKKNQGGCWGASAPQIPSVQYPKNKSPVDEEEDADVQDAYERIGNAEGVEARHGLVHHEDALHVW